MRRSEEINFSKTLNGKLKLTDFHSSFSSLPAIFTAISVASYDRSISGFRVDTDMEGLEKLSRRIDETKSALHWYVSSVGELLAEANPKEISESCSAGMGWLVADLGNLSSKLEEASDLVRYDLDKRKEAVTRSTAA